MDDEGEIFCKHKNGASLNLHDLCRFQLKMSITRSNHKMIEEDRKKGCGKTGYFTFGNCKYVRNMDL